MSSHGRVAPWASLPLGPRCRLRLRSCSTTPSTLPPPGRRGNRAAQHPRGHGHLRGELPLRQLGPAPRRRHRHTQRARGPRGALPSYHPTIATRPVPEPFTLPPTHCPQPSWPCPTPHPAHPQPRPAVSAPPCTLTLTPGGHAPVLRHGVKAKGGRPRHGLRLRRTLWRAARPNPNPNPQPQPQPPTPNPQPQPSP